MGARYTATARYLHWLVAGLIVLQFVLAQWAEAAESNGSALRQLALLANHKSVGITIFALAVLRLCWRLTHAPPPLPARMPAWQVRAAGLGHALLYGLLLALPLTGWLMSSASAYSVSWFNVITLPDLIGADPARKEWLEEIHHTLALVLAATALGHMAVALLHHFRDRDDVLRRMSSPGALIIAVLVLSGGVAWLGFGSRAGEGADPAAVAVATAAGSAQVTTGTTASPATPTSRNDADHSDNAVSSLPAWQIDHEASSIRFTAEQAGAGFQGVFESWEAVIHFHPDRLADSRTEVRIRLDSVNTRDVDRDQTLGQSEWFGGGQATFRATAFAMLPDGGFETRNATLSFGQQAYPVSLQFTLEPRGEQVTLQGTAQLDRLALNVGTGEWRDTTWVGQHVDVNVQVTAQWIPEPL